MSTIGIIVNPHAGKDIRRLVSAAGHTSDSAKIGVLRRVISGAAEGGATRILVSSDSHRLGDHAVEGLDVPYERLDGPRTGSALDSVIAAEALWKQDAGAVVVLGGDGTCRDVAKGWPGAPFVGISTGTNNVYPRMVDGTSAGVAAALVAEGAVPLEEVGVPSKRVALRIDDGDGSTDEVALVEAALIDSHFVGARAVTAPSMIRWIVAAIADPASTGLASVAGRVQPLGRDEPGGLLLRLGEGGRTVRVPLAPGTFATVGVESVTALPERSPVEVEGGGVLAYDGERTTPVSPDATVTIEIDPAGPLVIDVAATLRHAAERGLFDASPTGP
mgnify:FL=1